MKTSFKISFDACFFFYATKRKSRFAGDFVATCFRSVSLCWNCAFAHFQNKFEKLFACFFFYATKRNSHNKKAFENAFAFLEKGENDWTVKLLCCKSWSGKKFSTQSLLSCEENRCWWFYIVLIIHFENQFQNFICCLFFLFSNCELVKNGCFISTLMLSCSDFLRQEFTLK